jgi:phosphoglycerol transferase
MKKINYGFLLSNEFLLLLIVFSVFYLIFRNLSSYPITMADEWLYSHFSVFEHGSKSIRNNHFFYLIYSYTSQCGSFFLQCGRVLNLVFYCIGIFVIFLLSRKYLPLNLSLLVAFISLIYPNNAYTIYFMPESMFFSFFWIFVYFLFNYDKQRFQLIILSVILALTFLIKPHILIITPGILLVLIIKNNNKINAELIVEIFSMAIAFIFFRYLFSALYTGSLNFNFFDSSNYHDYSASLSSLFNFKVILKLLPLIPYYIFNHVKGIFLSLNLLLFFTFFLKESKSLKDIIISKYFFLLTLITALIVIAIFQVEFFLFYPEYFYAPYEVFGRLSQRHYDFIFPGIIMNAFFYIFHQYTDYSEVDNTFYWKKNVVLLVILTIFSAFIISYKFGASNILFTDAPTLSAILRKNYFLILISIGIPFFLLIKIRKAYMFLLIVITAILLQYNLSKILIKNNNHSIYDDAGIVSNIINPSSKVMFYGYDQAGLYKALFYRPDNSEFRILTNNYDENMDVICKENFDLHILINYNKIDRNQFKECNLFFVN